jgi:hypothetical protein
MRREIERAPLRLETTLVHAWNEVGRRVDKRGLLVAPGISSWKRASKRPRRTIIDPLSGSASGEYGSASGSAESCAAACGGDHRRDV